MNPPNPCAYLHCLFQKNHINALILGTKWRVHNDSIQTSLESVEKCVLLAQIGPYKVNLGLERFGILTCYPNGIGINVKANTVSSVFAYVSMDIT